MKTALYEAHVEGELVYIGITNNPERRLAFHKARGTLPRNAEMNVVRWHRTRQSAEKAEKRAIAEKRPRLNIRGLQFTSRQDKASVQQRRRWQREQHKMADYVAVWDRLNKEMQAVADELGPDGLRAVGKRFNVSHTTIEDYTDGPGRRRKGK